MEGTQAKFVKMFQGMDNLSRYKGIAQKLAKNISNLAEDENTRVRWIWELIQNAKDVSNEFGKCKINIDVYDDKFIFSHNGDPFEMKHLKSLVDQYSSKSEENKDDSETTGKYGTGFITTYILSRKVKIKGILSGSSGEDDINIDKMFD